METILKKLDQQIQDDPDTFASAAQTAIGEVNRSDMSDLKKSLLTVSLLWFKRNWDRTTLPSDAVNAQMKVEEQKLASMG